MKLIISTIVGGIVFFVLGWLLYDVIFVSFYTQHFGAIMRSPDDYKLWAMIVGCFLEAFFLALIYPRFYKGGSSAKEGFMFGLLIGLLTSVPYVFFIWSSQPVTYVAAIVDAILMFIMVWIYGKIEKPAATT
jgi:hypothetical protein